MIPRFAKALSMLARGVSKGRRSFSFFLSIQSHIIHFLGFQHRTSLERGQCKVGSKQGSETTRCRLYGRLNKRRKGTCHDRNREKNKLYIQGWDISTSEGYAYVGLPQVGLWYILQIGEQSKLKSALHLDIRTADFCHSTRRVSCGPRRTNCPWPPFRHRLHLHE